MCVSKSFPFALTVNHRSTLLLPSSSTDSLFGVAYRSPHQLPRHRRPAPLLRPRATESSTVVIGHWVRRPGRRSDSCSCRSGRASGVLHATSILTPGPKHQEPRYAAACEPDILGARFEQLRKELLRCITILSTRDISALPHPLRTSNSRRGQTISSTALVYVLRMHLVGCEVVGVPIASRNAQDENTCSVGRRTLPAGSTTAR